MAKCIESHERKENSDIFLIFIASPIYLKGSLIEKWLECKNQ